MSETQPEVPQVPELDPKTTEKEPKVEPEHHENEPKVEPEHHEKDDSSDEEHHHEGHEGHDHAGHEHDGHDHEGHEHTGDKKSSRGEKKFKKAMTKLGMKPVPGINRVTIKKAKSLLLYIDDPEILKNPGSDNSYIIFGLFSVFLNLKKTFFTCRRSKDS